MGQSIELRDTTIIGDVALFDTDRSISGQDGDAFTSAEEAALGTTFSSRLAVRIFAADPAVASVFVQSNLISVSTSGTWTDTAHIAEVIEQFFIHYEENL